MSAPAIELTDVALSVAGREVLSGVTLRLEAGETVAILGPSGAGKSTLLRVVLGLVAPSRGEIRIGGRLVSSPGRVLVPPEGRGLGMVFQDLALWPHLSVRGNLAFAQRSRRSPVIGEEISRILEAVGLSGLEGRRPADLSGGERQRVAIARAMVGRPAAVLLDEPLASLDIALRREMVDLFARVLSAAEVPTLHVSHDPRDAARLAGRLAILETGRFVQVGTAAEIAGAPVSAFAHAVADELRREATGELAP